MNAEKYDIVEFAAVVSVAKEMREFYTVMNFLDGFCERGEKMDRFLNILSEVQMVVRVYKQGIWGEEGEYVWEWTDW